jgi:hypothetical protein
MPSRVNHSVHHHCVANHTKDDSIGKPFRISPSHLQSLSNDTVKQWVDGQARYLVATARRNSRPRPDYCFSYHALSIEKIGIHFRADDEMVFHSPNLRLRLASNSSHEMALAGSFS